jgi:hypothetical protein
MSNWQSIDLKRLIPTELLSAIDQITSVVEQFIEMFKLGLEGAKIYESLLLSGPPDILQVAINVLVTAIEALLDAGHISVLFVPLPRQALPPVAIASSPFTLDAYAQSLGVSLEDEEIAFSPGAQAGYSALMAPRGGNAAFYRSIVTSLRDAYDLNRPQYDDPTSAVTMTVLMVGATTFADIGSAASTLNRLFKPPANSDLTARMIPVPQNVKASVIGLSTSAGIGVTLRWDPPPDVFSSPFFPAVSTQVDEYAVIRCTDPAVASSAQSVLDFFSTRELTLGLTSDDKAQVSKVIGVGSGYNSMFIDDDSALSATETYYYCVAWKIAVNEGGTVTTLPYDRVSNVVKTRVKSAPPQVTAGSSWITYRNTIDFVPGLSEQVDAMLSQIKAIGNRQTTGAKGAVSTAITMMEASADEILAQLDALTAKIKRFSAAVSEPLPPLYSTSITGVGGTTYLVGELAARLNDRSDPNRPPFDEAQYVLGIAIVAGAPRLTDIQPIVDFLNTLFQPAADENPIAAALATVNGAITATEQIVFGPNMVPYENNADGTVQIPAGTQLPDGTTVPAGGVSVAVSDIDPATGLPAVTSQPVISADGTPVAADSPDNPYAGDP